jgi:hypothetical protein
MRAANWYRKAAAQNDQGAQFNLGEMYQMGVGVPQDYGEAYFWLDIAAANNGPLPRGGALKARDEAASHLTPDLLLQIQERARKWFQDHPANPQ